MTCASRLPTIADSILGGEILSWTSTCDAASCEKTLALISDGRACWSTLRFVWPPLPKSNAITLIPCWTSACICSTEYDWARAGFCSTIVLNAAFIVCGSMSIARHVGGIEMLKPSEARVTVDQPAGKGLFVG